MNHAVRASQAFSLVEILIVVAVVGVLAGVTVPLITGVPDAAKKEKLEQDVTVINNAIDSYLASGGDPTQLTSAGVLGALKSRVSGGMPAEMLGPQGPFIDVSVVTNSTDFGWSALFTTEPRPRFYVAQRTDGVVFGRGEATEVGGVADRVDQDRTGWLWSYADPETPTQSDTVLAPPTKDEGASTFTRSSLTDLEGPVFSPPSGTYPLGDFATLGPLQLSDPNPPGSSRIVFSVDGGVSWAAYAAPLPLSPGEVIALAVSLDPSRYANSRPAVTNTIVGQPVVTWSSTNTDMSYSAVLSNLHGLTASVDGSGPFEIAYTAGGVTTNVITLPHPTNWGGNTLSITAQAVITNGSPHYVDSEPTNTTITAASQVLGTPSMSPPGEYVFGSKVVNFVAAPGTPADVAVRFFYTTDGSMPTPESGTEGDFVIISGLLANQRVTNRLIAAAPTGLEAWFETSGDATEIYLAPNFNFNDAGLIVVGGNIGNAEVIGSIILVSADGSVPPTITFANNASLDGDIYAPGTPNIYVDKKLIASSRVTDLDGPEEPVYDIYVDKVDWTGSVFRRITPVTVPPVTLPVGLEVQAPVTSSAPAGFQLPPGYYSSVELANNQVIKLGVEGSTDPVVYQFDDFSLGNGVVVQVVGPVVLTLNPGPNQDIDIGNNTALSVGNSSHPEWLQIKMYTGNLNLGNKASLYASILNPNGAVSLGESSTFRGSVTARALTVDNSANVTFDIPPPTL